MSDSDESRDEASPEATAIESPEASEEAADEFNPFDEIAEDFKPGPAIRVLGEDGLPKTVDQTTSSDIPRLNTTTLVCMGDESMFVVRNQWREPIFWFEANDVERAQDGRWRVPRDTLLKNFAPAIAEYRKKHSYYSAREQDSKLLELALGERGLTLLDGFLLVEPKRPPCKHYVRQMTAWSLNADHQAILRLCAARRTTEGTFMSVRDTGMWACDMREPRDVESVGQLDEFDRRKIEEGKHVEYLPMFGGGSGIFEPKG